MLSSTLILIVLSLFLGIGAWLVFVWAVKKGEFDDIEGPKHRIVITSYSIHYTKLYDWYFVSPYDFFPRLLAADLGGGILLALTITAGVVWLDLALVRRLLCREFCPYGRFQTVLVDPGTLVLQS